MVNLSCSAIWSNSGSAPEPAWLVCPNRLWPGLTCAGPFSAPPPSSPPACTEAVASLWAESPLPASAPCYSAYQRPGHRQRTNRSCSAPDARRYLGCVKRRYLSLQPGDQLLQPLLLLGLLQQGVLQLVHPHLGIVAQLLVEAQLGCSLCGCLKDFSQLKSTVIQYKPTAYTYFKWIECQFKLLQSTSDSSLRTLLLSSDICLSLVPLLTCSSSSCRSVSHNFSDISLTCSVCFSRFSWNQNHTDQSTVGAVVLSWTGNKGFRHECTSASWILFFSDCCRKLKAYSWVLASTIISRASFTSLCTRQAHQPAGEDTHWHCNLRR